MAQWNQCWFCGCKLLLTKRDHPRQRTVDHFIPKFFGGDKFVDACKKCNNQRGHSSIQEYREYLGVEKFFGEERKWMPW